MSERQNLDGIEVRGAQAHTSTSATKAGLLAWPEEYVALARQRWSRRRTLAMAGALATLGGIAVVRVLRPKARSDTTISRVKRAGRRLISWALVARTGRWLLPYAIRAVRSSRVGRHDPLRASVAAYGPA